jgi:hypothetical protein
MFFTLLFSLIKYFAQEKKDEVVAKKTQEDIDQEEEEIINQSFEKRGFHIPHYSKIYGWDKVSCIM